ncbi:MAG TPA: FecR family protein [Spirochaetota bacterium]|nr:FecR family protein [Spirochaetota bacterium]HPI89818.1 FecR family protein [Spirochaetota bacterium]HPR49388.1 FecR family protein [Spirochaetota bacterium]
MIDFNTVNRTFRYLCITLIAVSLSVVSCKKETPVDETKPAVKGIVLFSVGEVALLKEGQTEVPLEIQATVGSGDTVKTGAKSFTTIQFEDKGLIRIQENTTLCLTSLFGEGNGELLLKNGQVLTKINRLMKGEQFQIKTPTAVASVRGTEYSTSYKNGRSLIAVKQGKVAVATKEAAAEGAEADYTEKVVIEEGNTAVVITIEGEGETAATKVETRPISEVESLTVQKVSMIEMVPEPEKKSKEELEEMQRAVIKEEIKIDKDLAPREKQEKIMTMIEKKNNTLEEIKEVFERIDEISLYNGRMIQGAIISRGDKYKVLTTTGTMDINESDIKKVRVIK